MIAQLNIFYRFCLYSFIGLLALPVFAGKVPTVTDSQLPDDIVGAVCVIRHDNKMVMLSEVITKKVSLPGGYIDAGDTAQQAAAREALEEAGIVVEVKELLQYRGRAAIFSCVAESPILVSSFKDDSGHPIVASWFSKHFSTEIERVYLIDPKEINPGDYRYPDDAALLGDWLASTPSSEIQVYSDLSERVNFLHRYELDLIRQFQLAVKAQPAPFQAVFEGMMYVANLPGEPVFIALLVIVVAGLYGPRAMLQLVFMMLLAVFMTSLLKLLVASPRPSNIIPELQQINAYGFGFPSTHTFMATILWGGCWYKLCEKLRGALKWLLLPVFVLPVIGMAVARVWYGVHFITDTVASILLGLTVVMMIILWWSAPRASLQNCIGNRWFWLYSSVIVGLAASITLSPLHVYIFAILLGILFAVEIVPESPAETSYFWHFIIMVAVAAGLAVIVYGVEILASQLTVSLIVLGVRGVGWLIAAVWLVAASSLLHRKMAIRGLRID